MRPFLACFLALLLCLPGCSLQMEQPQAVSRETLEELQSQLYPAPQPEPEPAPEPQPQPEPEPTPEELRLSRAREILEGMTLEQTVGQVFFVRCPDSADDGAALMEQYQFGGYLLFKRDFQDAAGNWLTADAFTARLEDYRAGAHIAPFFGVDEEGGTVTRASQNPNLFPEGKFRSPQKLFSQGGMEAIFQDVALKSQQLLRYGINVNFAPVVDVTTQPGDFMYDRALGQDAQATAAYAEGVVAQMTANGVGAVLKHFPGYGNNRDTHTGVVIDDRPLEQFLESDLLPFRAGIDAGSTAVLVSHNIVNAMDSTLPASLSPQVYRVLREELGFTGVALTDDLAMDAVEDYTAGGAAAVMALQAGADMILSSYPTTEINQVLLALENGDLTLERLQEAALRVLLWKLELGVIQ